MKVSEPSPDNERGTITTDFADIKNIGRGYNE